MSYYRGDYYRGDYYRGDPGLFKFLGKALGKVIGVASHVLPGPVGLAARGASSLLERGNKMVAGRVGQFGIGAFTPSVVPPVSQVVPPVPGAVPQGRRQKTARRGRPKRLARSVRSHNLSAHRATMRRIHDAHSMGGNH